MKYTKNNYVKFSDLNLLNDDDTLIVNRVTINEMYVNYCLKNETNQNKISIISDARQRLLEADRKSIFHRPVFGVEMKVKDIKIAFTEECASVSSFKSPTTKRNIQNNEINY